MTSAVAVTVSLQGVCPPVRDQGDRPTCLACATSDAHAMHHGCAPLSAEFLFYQAIQMATVGNLTDGILFEEAAAALDTHGQPAEQEWPYSPIQPNPWTPPTVTTIWEANLQHDAANAVSQIISLVTSGKPVVLGIRLSAGLLSPIPPPFLIDGAGDGFGGHAVLVVGLGYVSTTPYFLIRNSWGIGWANQGYAWLAADYLVDKLIGFAPIVPKT